MPAMHDSQPTTFQPETDGMATDHFLALTAPDIARHLSAEEYSLVFHQIINEPFYTDDFNDLFESLEVVNENINTLNGANRMIYIEE